MSYKHGNFSDRVKHANLERAVRAVMPSLYVELHSAEGLYYLEENSKNHCKVEIYPGSSYRVLEILKGRKRVVYLHEKMDHTREELKKNVQCFQPVHVRGEWQKHIKQYIDLALKSHHFGKSFFLIDPSYLVEYLELFEVIKDLLYARAHVFMFAPMRKNHKLDLAIVNLLAELCQEFTSPGMHCKMISHDAGKSGERVDYNFFHTNIGADYTFKNDGT